MNTAARLNNAISAATGPPTPLPKGLKEVPPEDPAGTVGTVGTVGVEVGARRSGRAASGEVSPGTRPANHTSPSGLGAAGRTVISAGERPLVSVGPLGGVETRTGAPLLGPPSGEGRPATT